MFYRYIVCDLFIIAGIEGGFSTGMEEKDEEKEETLGVHPRLQPKRKKAEMSSSEYYMAMIDIEERKLRLQEKIPRGKAEAA